MESVIALVVAAIMFMALTVVAISSVKAAVVARQNQQSGDILDRTLEAARSVSYDKLSMDPADLQVNDTIGNCANGKPGLDPGTGTCENVVSATGGAISPHVDSTQKLNNVTYTTKTYVTTPVDQTNAKYKRVTVVLTWSSYGRSHTRRISTFVADTQRGLPLPLFKFSAIGDTTVPANPGSTVHFGLKVTNQGARDSWDLAASDATLGWSWVFDDGDGVYDLSTDTTAVTDTDGNGVRDTGSIEPTDSVLVWVTRTVPSSPNSTYSVNTDFTATSVAQPGIANVSTKTLSTTTNVTPGASGGTGGTTSGCPAQSNPPVASGVTQRTYYLHNYPPGVPATGNTTTLPLLSIDGTAPTSTTISNYSTDVTSSVASGRDIAVSTNGVSETDTKKAAIFKWPNTISGSSKVDGTVTVTLWAEPSSSMTTDGVSLKAWLQPWKKSGSSYAPQTAYASSTVTTTPWGCSAFNKVTLGIPVSGLTLANNDYLEIWVENVGSTPVRVQYDNTAYPAAMVIPLS